jgi:hypothetical protein
MFSINEAPRNYESTSASDRLGDFDQRQRRAYSAFREFARDLQRADAEIILSDITLSGVKAISASEPLQANSWLDLLTPLHDDELRKLHRFAFLVAVALAANGNTKAVPFITRLIKLDPIIRRVSGPAKVNVEALDLWQHGDLEAFRTLCERRLISSRNDGELALEVLAASLQGKQQIVADVVDKLLESGQPSNIGRALTISGFSDVGQHPSSVIERYEGATGYVGMAQRAARGCYERNSWSRKWYYEMLSAPDPESFWRSSVILSKIVDARYEIWQDAMGTGTAVFNGCIPTVRRDIRARIMKWQTKRLSLLFGGAAPQALFLSAIPAAG